MIAEELAKVLQKQAVVGVKPLEGQFMSQIFLVPKRDGTQRPVVNVKPLNQFIKRHHFKMEGGVCSKIS